MNASCQFHGVGQGLYYDCTIREDSGKDIFRFVYDCGSFSNSDTADLCQQIKKDKSTPKKRLDALFVSHFDIDHVSAIPTLLDVFDVQNVFIPYFSPEELKLLALLAEGADERLYKLYEDPASYFKNAGCKILYIFHPQAAQSGREGSLDEPDARYKNYHETGDFTLQGNIWGDTNARSEMNVVHCDGSANATCFRAEWQFRIYQDQKNKVREDIRKKIRRLIPKDQSLEELLKNETLRKKAKEIYGTVKHKINQTSLVLYHAPLEGRRRAWIEPICRDGYWCRCYCLRQYGGGTLLTGDIGLTRLQNRGADLEKFVGGGASKP